MPCWTSAFTDNRLFAMANVSTLLNYTVTSASPSIILYLQRSSHRSAASGLVLLSMPHHEPVVPADGTPTAWGPGCWPLRAWW